MIIVRYADDFIVGFQHESDARCFLDEMRERLRKLTLSLHPREDPAHRVRTLCSGTPQAARARQAEPKLLGFTFICGKTRAGKFQLQRKTRRDRMRTKLRMIKEEMWRRMHQPIPIQGKWLWHVVHGSFNYHAVPTNSRALVAFRTEIAKRWHRVLTRRSERTTLNWERMKRLIGEWLPRPRFLHPWPDKRFAVSYPR